MKTRGSTSLVRAIVCVTASLLGCLSLAAPTAASSAPAVHVNTSIANIGELIYITGSGWSPVGQTVEIELCGQNARDLSSDCDLTNQYSAAIRAGGIFYGALTVRLPPSPCPCVVKVASQGSFGGIDVPITIIGARTSLVPPQAPPAAPVALSARILAPQSLTAWFGGPKPVTLLLRVANVSSYAVGPSTLTVNVGKGPNPSGFVVARSMSQLAVGATRVLRIPVTLPALTYGRYSVRAQVLTPEGQVAQVAWTSSYPWGLVAAGCIILLAFGLILWRRLRRRAEGQNELPELAEEPEVEGVEAPREAVRT